MPSNISILYKHYKLSYKDETMKIRTLITSISLLGLSLSCNSATLDSPCKHQSLSCIHKVDNTFSHCIDTHKTKDHSIPKQCELSYNSGADQCYANFKQCMSQPPTSS